MCTLLCDKYLHRFYSLVHIIGSTSNTHLDAIKEGVGKYLFPVNVIVKKITTSHTMRKPHSMTETLQIMKNETQWVPIPFLWSENSKIMEEEELNIIIFHSVPNGW